MFVTWAIDYLDRTDEQRERQDRQLYLETNTLDPATKAAVELLVESGGVRADRAILKFRHLFRDVHTEHFDAALAARSDFRQVSLGDYVEDETGKELSNAEVAELVTGSPTAVLLPTGVQQHDVDYIMSEPKPVPLAEITLTPDQIKVFAIFSKDYRELTNSAFMKDGPGTLKATASRSLSTIEEPTLETAASEEEIRSFVTIFRRLYMTGDPARPLTTGEPANFMKVADLFEKVLAGHARAKWVKAVSQVYDNELKSKVETRPFVQKGQCTFDRKRIIDVFIYTQYAHQPDERRQRQFDDCLKELNGWKQFLTWLFLTELWKASLRIKSAGKIIVGWFDQYCAHHGVSHDIHPSVAESSPGIGVKEKEADRLARIRREKTEQLATDIWTEKGSPAGGPTQFMNQAKEQINKALGA